jgi:hypothetical protein
LELANFGFFDSFKEVGRFLKKLGNFGEFFESWKKFLNVIEEIGEFLKTEKICGAFCEPRKFECYWKLKAYEIFATNTAENNYELQRN